MEDKLKPIVDGAQDEAQRRRLAVHDALRARLRIEIAGVDIGALPRLPPELKPAAPGDPAAPDGRGERP